MAKRVFKRHHFGQIMLLPPSLDEMKDTEPLHFEQIAPEAVKQAIEKIDQAIKDKEVDKKVKQKINYATKNWPEKLKRYEDQEKILGKRNN